MNVYEEIAKADIMGLDTETTGLYYPRDKAFMASIATDTGVWAIDLREEGITKLRMAIMRNRKLIIVAHNASFDYRMLSSAGITTDLNKWRCTVVRACLIDEHEATIFPWTKRPGNYSLDALGEKYLGARKDTDFHKDACEALGISERTAKGKVMARIAELPPSLVARYARTDAELALRLYRWQSESIDEQGLHAIVNFETKLMPTLIRSEMRGIDVDLDRTEQAMGELDKVIQKRQKELDKAVGREFNVNSTPQVRELFEPLKEGHQWYAIDGTPLESTKSGNPSFGGQALHNMSHPIAKDILEIRSLIKTRDVFLGSHILGHQIDGKVYPNINQTKGETGGTGTGRLSYTEPAMQQIPSRNKSVAEIVKPCFLPPEGMKWLETDLASFEVRVFAHLVAAYNNALVKAYEKNPLMDFHQWVADMVGLVRNATYNGEPNAKQLNLSMIFNQGKGATAMKMGMPWEWDSFEKDGKTIRYQKAGPEALDIINAYHRRVQGVHTLAERAKAHAESKGQIQTAIGRRLRFPRGYKSYKASGILIQATAADINKRNWMVIEEALGSQGHLMLNTHDSYSMAVEEDWKPIYGRVKEAIEDMSDIKFRVPLILDLDGCGSDWWAAKQGELTCS